MQPAERPERGSVGAVIVAAGSSTRMGGVDKLFLRLDGVPVIVRAVRPFCETDWVGEIVIVCREKDLALLWDWQREYALTRVRTIVAGGASRQASVFAGVRALSEQCSLIAIHDGARCFVPPAVIEDAALTAYRTRAACAGVPMRDTVKRAGEDGVISATLPRDDLFLAQTPQVFERTLYLEAMAHAEASGADYTDDCQLVEALGQPVTLSKGSILNFKLTTPEDLCLAQALAAGEIQWEGPA